MKARFVLSAKLMLLAAVFLLMGCNSNTKPTDTRNDDHIVVLVSYTSQPNKETETFNELTKLVEHVKNEPHFVSIKLHVDPKDKLNILLYEEWDDETYYTTEHMQTSHLQKFIADSRNFLNGPPEVSFWKLEKEFK
ncbi:antibiotic biosynthesis monooxygenase [uncultured Gelidibacter sp.]|uniref:putative quinol monooxygenase n=1 Tax=uncultured Gelidibacter sp. TaxID=259318 RepID=UPI002621FC8D|nr:antibiotic biosynthesis monooxygenase [uncultured Gelidibacter sp.]